MATGTITITPDGSFDIPDGSGEIPSALYIKQFVQKASYGNFTRDHVKKDTTSFVTISATEPSGATTGEMWLDTSSSPHVLKRYDGSTFVAIWSVSSSAPASTDDGLPWYDTTLDIVRVYDTIDSITGWHPTDSAYQLWTNRSGGTVSANNVVVFDNTGTSEREFTTTTTVKDQSVVGVTLESIDDDSSGVLATVGGDAVCDVLADDGEIFGAIVKGDGLVTFSVAGECRTVGPLNSNYITESGGQAQVGTPAGCFARALGTKNSQTHLVRAKMLGHVGNGATAWTGQNTIVASMTEGSDEEADFSGSELNSKHLPVLGVHVSANIQDDAGAPGDNAVVTLSAKSTATRVVYTHTVQGKAGTAGAFGANMAPVFIPTVDDTSAASATAPGNLFLYNLSSTVGGGYIFKSLDSTGYLF